MRGYEDLPTEVCGTTGVKPRRVVQFVPQRERNCRVEAKECASLLRHVLDEAERGLYRDVCVMMVGTDDSNGYIATGNYRVRERVACLTRLLHAWQIDLWHER